MPSRPGGMTAIYRHLAADEQRTRQVIADVLTALSKDRNCLVLTNRTSHLERLADLLRDAGHDPVPRRADRQQGQPDQYVGRILRSHENKTTAEVHDYLVLIGPASSPPCSPNARPATPVSASPTRAGSHSLLASARTGNRLRKPQYHADVILCLCNVALREAAAVPYALVMTPEVRAWLHDLRKRDRASAIQVGQAIGMLLEAGPELGRPTCRPCHHTRLSNLKELRPGSAGRSEIRIRTYSTPGVTRSCW